MRAQQYWKEKYDKLRMALQELHETANEFMNDDVPVECISSSDSFFVSNALEIVDNETYAKRHWGEGKYFKMFRVDPGRQKKAP